MLRTRGCVDGAARTAKRIRDTRWANVTNGRAQTRYGPCHHINRILDRTGKTRISDAVGLILVSQMIYTLLLSLPDRSELHGCLRGNRLQPRFVPLPGLVLSLTGQN